MCSLNNEVIYAGSLSEPPYEQYKSALIESEVFGREFAQGKRYVRYDRMETGDIELLLEQTDKLINLWNAED